MARSTIDAAPPGMKWIDGGEFAMGSDAFYAEERPVHRVAVDGFWMDEHAGDRCRLPALRPRDTGYVTVAERPLDPDDYPDADPELLVPGSVVFQKSRGPVTLRRLPKLVVATSPGRPGSARAAPARRSTDAITTPSSRSPMRTPRRTRPGRARSFRPKPSGSTRLAAGSMEPSSPGVTPSSRREDRWRTPGRASSPGRT